MHRLFIIALIAAVGLAACAPKTEAEPLAGPTGVPGPRGERGAEGAQGPAGADGKDGRDYDPTVLVTAVADEVAAQIAALSLQDAILATIEASADLFIGPQGETGPPGPAGPPGEPGPARPQAIVASPDVIKPNTATSITIFGWGFAQSAVSLYVLPYGGQGVTASGAAVPTNIGIFEGQVNTLGLPAGDYSVRAVQDGVTRAVAIIHVRG